MGRALYSGLWGRHPQPEEPLIDWAHGTIRDDICVLVLRPAGVWAAAEVNIAKVAGGRAPGLRNRHFTLGVVDAGTHLA